MKTLKVVAARYNATSLILRIVIGLVVGAVLALAVPGAGWVEEFGSLFVGALKGIAPVLVFVIVASALAQGTSRLDRRFGTVIWLYMLTTFLAAAIAVVTSFLFPQTVVLAEAAESEVVPQGGTWMCKSDVIKAGDWAKITAQSKEAVPSFISVKVKRMSITAVLMNPL